MNPGDIACVVLASGQSRRFGVADKLQADLGGKSVLEMVLETVNSVGFGRDYVVAQRRIEGNFEWIENSHADAGQGFALRLGLRAASKAGWNNVMVVLGDMPLVSRVNLVNLIESNHIKQSIVSECKGVRMPPALFLKDAVEFVLASHDKKGARSLFENLQPMTVSIDRDSSRDVDTPADLDRVREILKLREF